MSITGIAATQATPGVASVLGNANTSATGGGVTYGLGSGAAGGYVAQGVPGTSSLIKKVLIGSVVGAGLGFGASFLSLPIIGGIAAPIMAAAGAGIGAVGGLVWHLVSKHKANLALQQQAAIQGPVTQPTTVAAPTAGTVLRVGSHGGATVTLQTNLKKLGLYNGSVSGQYDKATSMAVRRFELLKGVQPTGLASPDVRTALEQDAGLAGQFLTV